MDAFEVSHFRFITSFHQSIETSLHQFGNTTAQNCLFTEQVGFGFFLEGSFQDTCTACTDTGSICQSIILCLTGVVLIYSDQRGNALTGNILASYGMTGALGSYHDNVDIRSGLDLIEVDVETMSEHQNVAFLHVLRNLSIVDMSSQFVRYQHHYNVAGFCSFFNFHNLQTCSFCLGGVSGTLSQTNDYVAAAFLQVLCVSMALAAEAQDGDCLTV